ncbi:hypothetical protein [Bifidobacterium asteroides]|nr:hypothetical protein [Bifidobacterium asteroides]
MAPNVVDGGNSLFNTRSTAGNLDDIIIAGSGQAPSRSRST